MQNSYCDHRNFDSVNKGEDNIYVSFCGETVGNKRGSMWSLYITR